MIGNVAAPTTVGSRRQQIYKPEERRELAFTVYGEADIPAHWRGWVPNPSAERRTVGFGGDVGVAEGLLHGGFSNLSVLVWATLYSWFREQEGRFSSQDLAQALYCPPITMAHVAEVAMALQSLVGNWVRRGRDREGDFYSVDFCHPDGPRNGVLRDEQFAELLVEGQTQDHKISHADLVNFARWHRECTRGWTIESMRRLAEKWRMTYRAVRASRQRLAALGWLIVHPRRGESNDDSCLVWISELYDPNAQMVELHGSSPSPATSDLGPSTDRISIWHGLGRESLAAGRLLHRLRAELGSQPLTVSFDQISWQTGSATQASSTSQHEQSLAKPLGPFDVVDPVAVEAADCRVGRDIDVEHPGRPSEHPPATTALPRLTELRLARARRRRAALLVLTSLQDGFDHRTAIGLRTHEVYLIHFPEEGCFKVGLTHSTSHRISLFSRHGGIVVDRVAVDNKFLAEIVEVDVLDLTETWHQLGDRERPGSGYTEMWSDDGPTLDLEHVKLQATQLVTRLRDLMNGTPR